MAAAQWEPAEGPRATAGLSSSCHHASYLGKGGEKGGDPALVGRPSSPIPAVILIPSPPPIMDSSGTPLLRKSLHVYYMKLLAMAAIDKRKREEKRGAQCSGHCSKSSAL